jgi:hypothetical protein
MGYIEEIMGNNEQVLYRTHRHAIVLLQCAGGWLFAFVVFLGFGLSVLLPSAGQQGDQIRFLIGVIALCSLILPLYLIVSAWVRGHRGRRFFAKTWQAVGAAILILAVALLMMLRPDLRYTGWIALLLALAALAELVRNFLDWWNQRYLITNRRVMEIRGTINKRVSDSALEKVNDVLLVQSFVGRIMGYGTVEIITGSDIGANRFRRIAHPARFKRTMLNAKEQLHEDALPAKRDRVDHHEQPAPIRELAEEGVSPLTIDDIADRDIPAMIVELDELRRKGLLSEEEFQSKKRELLDRL